MKKMKNTDKNKDIAKFLFEVGILAKTPRSGFHFLGTGGQTVAEHISRTIFVGYTLATLDKADVFKVMKMCMLHDLGEARTSDLNYVHQMYVDKSERKAIEDSTMKLPFAGDISDIVDEFEDRKTKEAIIAKDADNLEWILSLKEQLDVGNKRAEDWIVIAIKRLKTPTAIEIAKIVFKTNSNSWWFDDKRDEWWVSRNKKKSKIKWNKK